MKPFLAVLVVLFGRRRSGLSDEELARRYAEGDARAIGTLFDRHGRFLLRYAALTAGGHAQAEDVLQEAFVRLMHALDQGTEVRNVHAFLTVTCRNLAIDGIRRSKRFPGPSLEQEDLPPLPQLATTRDALDEVADQTFGRALAEALARLPDEQRETFVRKEALGYKFREIADQMGVTESTVKSRLRYALSKLQAELGEWA